MRLSFSVGGGDGDAIINFIIPLSYEKCMSL